MKAERQHLTLKWSYRRCRERHRFALVHRLIADRVQHRVFIDFIDCHCDCFTIAEACRTIVTHHHLERVCAWSLRFRRRPGKDAGRRINGCSRWHSSSQTVGQCLVGTRIGGCRSKGQR